MALPARDADVGALCNADLGRQVENELDRSHWWRSTMVCGSSIARRTATVRRSRSTSLCRSRARHQVRRPAAMVPVLQMLLAGPKDPRWSVFHVPAATSCDTPRRAKTRRSARRSSKVWGVDSAKMIIRIVQSKGDFLLDNHDKDDRTFVVNSVKEWHFRSCRRSDEWRR